MRAPLLFLLLLLPLAAPAQVYKWVDERGRVQYGDKPPPNVRATPLPQPDYPPPKPRSVPEGEPEEAAFQRRQLERQQAEEQALRDRQARERSCAQARDRLALSQNARRPYRLQGEERIYLNDDERAAQIERLRAQVSQWCG